jgi:hypothetical protein
VDDPPEPEGHIRVVVHERRRQEPTGDRTARGERDEREESEAELR